MKEEKLVKDMNEDELLAAIHENCSELKNMMPDLMKENDILFKETVKLEKKVRKLTEENKKLKAAIQDIKDKLSYKAAQVLYNSECYVDALHIVNRCTKDVYKEN